MDESAHGRRVEVDGPVPAYAPPIHRAPALVVAPSFDWDRRWPDFQYLPSLVRRRNDQSTLRSVYHIRFAILVPFLLWVSTPSRLALEALNFNETAQDYPSKDTVGFLIAILCISFAVLALEHLVTWYAGWDTAWTPQLLIGLAFTGTMLYWVINIEDYGWFAVLFACALAVTALYLALRSSWFASHAQNNARGARRSSEKTISSPLNTFANHV